VALCIVAIAGACLGPTHPESGLRLSASITPDTIAAGQAMTVQVEIENPNQRSAYLNSASSCIATLIPYVDGKRVWLAGADFGCLAKDTL
jgi:hypothetical protein